MMLRGALLGLLLLLAAGPAAAQREMEVPGLGVVKFRPEGHPNLLIDYGRQLGPYLGRHGLRGARKDLRRHTPDWLSSVEKARLDARRIWSAPRLSPEEKLERLVAVVQHRFPENDAVLAAHERLTRHELGRRGDGFARLSRRTAHRVGRSFERAWLLQGLLEEVGVRSAVRTGELFDVMDRNRGPHAWVELDLDGRRRLADPSVAHSLPDVRPVPVANQGGGEGGPDRLYGLETLTGWVYLSPSPPARLGR